MGSALPADGVRPVTQTDCMHDWAGGPNAWGYHGGDAVGDNDGHPAARSISEGNLLRGVLTFRRANTIPSSGYELQAALWMSQLRKSSQTPRQPPAQTCMRCFGREFRVLIRQAAFLMCGRTGRA